MIGWCVWIDCGYIILVLHQEPNWFKRGVAEAIHIAQEDPILNLDRGRHTLPSIYNQILSRDITSSAESCDDAIP